MAVIDPEPRIPPEHRTAMKTVGLLQVRSLLLHKTGSREAHCLNRKTNKPDRQCAHNEEKTVDQFRLQETYPFGKKSQMGLP